MSSHSKQHTPWRCLTGLQNRGQPPPIYWAVLLGVPLIGDMLRQLVNVSVVYLHMG